jgi:hypothetical protein
MLQSGDGLRTWSLADPLDSLEQQIAEALDNHRPAYLDYEGPISGNRGFVRREDHGEYEVLTDADSELQVRLHGQRLCGTLKLSRQEPQGQRWRLSFTPA